MTGAAAGALIITSRLSRIKDCLKFFINTDLTITCFSLVLPIIFLILNPYLGSPGVFLSLKILFLVISFICGFLIGAQFPLANKIYLKDNPDFSETTGILYSSDLLGGWLGGIVGGMVLLPILGLLGSCIVVFLLKLSSFVIITTRLSKPREASSLSK
jgi:spermidine synthase